MRLLIMAFILALASAACLADWELRRDDLNKERPPIADGVVSLKIGDPGILFPRYLNELGVKTIQVHFQDGGGAQKKLSVVWTGGSQGPDKFAVSVDGVPAVQHRPPLRLRRWPGLLLRPAQGPPAGILKASPRLPTRCGAANFGRGGDQRSGAPTVLLTCCCGFCVESAASENPDLDAVLGGPLDLKSR